MQIREIGEFRLIQRLKKKKFFSYPSILKGIGDDCAVVKTSNSQSLLITCDLLLEGVHFNLAYTDSYQLGKKALAVNLSDIAAMGGIPLYYLVSLGLPPTLPLDFVDNLYKGMKEMSEEYKISLIGGNLSSSKKVFIDITMIGLSPPEEIIYRNGAQTGDVILVTGTLGDSSLGLTVLKSKKKKKKTPALLKIMEKHLTPKPRLKEGRFLAAHQLASAMIDISDGLILDLQHLLNESKKGAEIWIDKLPISPQTIYYSQIYKKDPVTLALTGGEDYELLFTLPKKMFKRYQELSQNLPLDATIIGKITSEKGKIHLIKKDGSLYHLKGKGFLHF